MERTLILSPTLSAVELDTEDVLNVQLLDGTHRRIVLKAAWTNVTRSGPLPYCNESGVISYRISCRLEVDGRLVHLVRNIPSQENFRDPPCFMGLRIWLDATAGIDKFLSVHGSAKCFPKKHCRLAIWDASQRICPPLLHAWCPLPPGTLRVEQCYNGDDTWMGPYNGSECHGGLDINHPAGTMLWTPVSIDEHGLFDSVEKGATNNRWRGLHHWPDGKTWILQAHHVIRLLVGEGRSIEAGVAFAEAAGVLSGGHEHTHFVFGIRENGEDILLDPWLLFWQMYQDRAATTAREP